MPKEECIDKSLLEEMGKRYLTNPISPTVVITFKNNGIPALRSLFLSNLAKFNDPILVEAIVRSSSWDSDENRKVLARFPMGIAWFDSFFQDQVSKGIEAIQIANENPLKALMTRRTKRQQEAFDVITAQCQTPKLMAELEEWGLTMDFWLDTTIPELPGIVVMIKSGEEVLFGIFLESWSGCIMCDKEIHPVAYGADGKEVHTVISAALAKHLNS